MISATKWIAKGKATQFPTKHALTEEEFQAISEKIGLELKISQDAASAIPELETEPVQDATPATLDELAKYHLESYDDEETMDPSHSALFSNIQGFLFLLILV